ncbi:putative sphingomyelin phosphodiesterase [Phaeomoniella chlamydospora]|uniref:Sphingomyelin phosphodiesterase n=1 Tax=Phaeomoniella chlamydospora TaxID=158046 RepID=A0A0G2E3Y4_PHACM|nr:putative sphingomyelin phosphodiesterase [Phaeomoniella chlamydospora]
MKRDTISDILTDIEEALECTACETLLVVLKALAHLGNDAFVDVITAVCTDLGIEDADVCEGAIGLEGPILAHDLRVMDIPSHTAQLFCSTVFGLCDYPEVTVYDVPFPSEKPANSSRPAPSGQTPIQVVHISDIHIDRFYETGASYNCTKNICCRPYTAADAPGNTSYPAGEYGNVNCDTPISLEESMYNAIQTLVPNASFTIFTGDVVEGAVWLVNETEVTDDLNDAFSRMTALNLVYGVVGNHDAAPVNSFPPAAIDTTIDSQWVYSTLSNAWEQWIGSTAAATEANYGAYSVKYPSGNLRLISFNSQLYYKENFWLYEKTMETDPDSQFAWLVAELNAAESAGERVWLMGHMPMGAGDALHDGSNYFNQIVTRYSDTIAALFFGHTHKDEFEITYSDYTNQSSSNAIAMSYIAPALTPTSGNPTFRVYTVDPVTFGILDYTTYITNISSPTYQSGPVWEKYYSVKETYGALVSPPVTNVSAELTPSFWHSLTSLFESNDTIFQEYYTRRTRGYDTTNCTDSDDNCKTDEICQLRAAEAQYNCVEITPGVNFRKRSLVHGHEKRGDGPESGSSHRDECGVSVSTSVFGSFTTDLDAFKGSLERALDGGGFSNSSVNDTVSS